MIGHFPPLTTNFLFWIQNFQGVWGTKPSASIDTSLVTEGTTEVTLLYLLPNGKDPGGRGSNTNPSGMENPVGWGVKLEKNPLRGGYGYFLEPHNLTY